ncbi:Uncharacterised protein [Vibrio owensii]|uniref:hypothetical protein n=1 Tax=Vibrio owensii TaxID=696485 RepID=UPI00039D1932|nr:hypothetical protein [Vibrio owensii]SUP93046.1 Uncharacterised protein [Vibrio owensii]
MHKVLFSLFAFGALLLTPPVYSAFYINGDVKVDGITWDNVTYGKGDTMVPSKWGVPPALRSVNSWSAGSLPAAAANSITLRGGMNGETTIPIPISITGVQYNTTGIDFAEDTNSLGGGCLTDEVTPPIVSVTGIGCISSTKLSVAVPTSPFILFRPMFNINETDVVAALKGKAEGVYSASVPITVRYYYENTSGISTFRNISDVVIFSFNYEPVEIADVVILEGNGVMEPNYDVTDRTVSAQTVYRLEAQGYFNNGIVLNMLDRDYNLVSSSSNSITIPYSVMCDKCSTSELVTEGRLIKQESYIGEGSGIQTNLPFNLTFKYDVEGTPLVSGSYTDSVTIIVSPRI